ncbi:TetR/AcrR family transcriptional regulator [Nocardia puris]|uniref:TetR family transcriptional regulator n=1 Tax=Nocardia puris TaxID=208602 RepID=A0A366E1Y6_9NOCA|nr:TetR/AcrR family transcriptional regulator [Nocardia puris]MBF6209589.1 TetR/AcrR family transcriptional regulator [Nocardia puris]MBF6366161.1 TetR/AcrR family transcriptional regulator [Nocardia puris]MBF6458500.1 TetR/AcrR family transcriptional regulator [Nocardia puris]RBO96145.1 TetR family transcriptional regulator [Nocardia puris]
MTATAGDAASGRRPRDRRLSVAKEAADMFAARGFAAVRMEDIARSVGVTARALYRHYRNKNELLYAVALASQDPYNVALDEAAAQSTPRARFRSAIAALVEVTLDGRSHAVLWQREARHLRPEERAVVRTRLTAIARRIADLIADYRGGPDGAGSPTVELLAWAVLSVVASTGHHTRTLPRPESDRILLAAAEAIALLDPPEPAGAAPAVVPLTSRREQILEHSARLFAERGYPAVSVEDIGEAAGILGPSVYHYFPSKELVLGALINRVNEWMTLGLFTAKGAATRPADALARMTEYYVSFAIRFPDLAGIAVTERLYLGDPAADTARRVRNELVAEWAAVLAEHRPELSPLAATLLTEVVIALVDDLARTPHLRKPGMATQVTALAEAVYAVALPATDDT